jgi:hypothetical protein
MALLEYTFDSPENPGLNRSIDFYNGYLAYQNGMKELHNQICCCFYGTIILRSRILGYSHGIA